MPARRLFSDAIESDIACRYLAGSTLNGLARAYSTSTTQIKRALHRTNTPLRASQIGTPNKRERGRRPSPAISSRMRYANARFNSSRLRESRLAHQISHAELARAVGVQTPDLIRRWENGEAVPTGLPMLRLLLALDLSPDELLA